MTLRSLLILLLAGSPALAQRTVDVRRITMPTKDAGIYHVATGTWTRGVGAQAGLGPDVIYRADAPTGYFAAGFNGVESVDEMVLPGTQHPKAAGPADSYLVDGFTFGWCSNDPGPIQWTFKFYDSYVPCDNPDAPSGCVHQVGTALSLALPAAGFCWTVTVDLSGSGYELCMTADGGPCAPGYQGGGLGLDHAGWGAVNQAVSTTGPVLAGYDPNWAPEGGGTCYDPFLPCPAGATGLGAQDLVGFGDPIGCWFGSGYNNTNGCGGPAQAPGRNFFSILYTDCTAVAGCTSACASSTYCDTNPDNAAELAMPDCTCSSGTAQLFLTGAVPGRFGYPLVGAGSGVVTDPPGAQGDLCLAGAQIGRYHQDAMYTDNGGNASLDVLNAITGGGGGNVPVIGGSLCNPAGQTWNFQWWHRDGMNPSRFSKALTVTFN